MQNGILTSIFHDVQLETVATPKRVMMYVILAMEEKGSS